VYVSSPEVSPDEAYAVVGDEILTSPAATRIDLDTPCKLAMAFARSQPPRIELLLHAEHGPVLRVDTALLEQYTITCPVLGRLVQVSSSPAGVVLKPESLDSYATAVRLQDGVLIQLESPANTGQQCFGAATSLGAIDRLAAGPTRLKSCWGMRSICLSLPLESALARVGSTVDLSGLVRELTAWAGLWQDAPAGLGMLVAHLGRGHSIPKWLDDILPAVESA
jgi:hypothetical protein